ncbi:NAD(P)-binding protein [Xylariaceae sp. FL1019]|nr:NAD(P)-binding protein [Xylariaceae sp. FL1019]
MAQSTGMWTLPAQDGLESLHYEANGPVRSEQDLGPDEVLVEICAASLNYRDIVVSQGGVSGSPMRLTAPPSMIPGSDGSGRILAIGSAVAPARPDLGPGVEVITHMVPCIVDDELPGYDQISSGLGGEINGTLCRRGIFHHGALVPKPKTLSHAQAATLTCSGLTAWNALMGYKGRMVKKDDWVLVQGTGGVSIAALQIALAAGANVIATTSSSAKASRLLSLGATHVLNYRETPSWGTAAKDLTPSSCGVDHVIDVGGPTTLPESMQAVRRDGLITISGLVGGLEGSVDMMAALWNICSLRGILLGTRDMLRDMVAFVDEHEIPIAVDAVVFSLEDAKGAYERLKEQKHFSKVIIMME